MQLKDYQVKVIQQLDAYLTHLAKRRSKWLSYDAEDRAEMHFPESAWKDHHKAEGNVAPTYNRSSNGLGEPLPSICFKVPTGGGKTLLACHAIERIQQLYLAQRTGLVLWIVPTDQIYRQTLGQLRDRNHPYRRMLEVASGGRVLVRTKTDRFTPLDVADSLVIMVLMLPSANRDNKETLKMFKDAGGYENFFPAEDNAQQQQALLEQYPNLDHFTAPNGLFAVQVKSSLGNVLRILQPLVVLDEGHKAYSPKARETLMGFNPRFLLELSATPTDTANKLVAITGQELAKEEMIKLDIHLRNKASFDWETTLLEAVEHRNKLEAEADRHRQQTNTYIRPIMLIQVERTGKDQQGANFIHAEAVRKFLIQNCSIPPDHVAIKSSEKDDIEGMDLLSADCVVRYIITKSALQEGWDCSFAYVLTILSNAQATTSLTQLIGRVLRQPYARKTGNLLLDECYVYTARQKTSELLKSIKNDLEKEGLGDLITRISAEDGSEKATQIETKTFGYQERFKRYEGQIFLPQFGVNDGASWRRLSYAADILRDIDWYQADLSSIYQTPLLDKPVDQYVRLTLADSASEVIKRQAEGADTVTLKVDLAFMAHQLVNIVPNPFVAMELCQTVVKGLRSSHEETAIAANFLYIIERLKELLVVERDRLAEEIFRRKVAEQQIRFFLLKTAGAFVLPRSIQVKFPLQTTPLINRIGKPVVKNLFDHVPADEYGKGDNSETSIEKQVALFFEEDERFLWWFRNLVKKDYYHLQAWKRDKIYPDFIAATADSTLSTEYDKVYVVESKGDHLRGNDDTNYKQNVFALCNELGVSVSWDELNFGAPDHRFVFQMVFEKDYKAQLAEMLN